MVPTSTLVDFIEEVTDLLWVNTLEVRDGVPSFVEEPVHKVVLGRFVLDTPCLNLIHWEFPYTKESYDWVHPVGAQSYLVNIHSKLGGG